MSPWTEMLQAARRAPEALGESTQLVRRFLLGEAAPDGGFKNRSGAPDLYYTIFGLAGLAALPETAADRGELLDGTLRFLRSFGAGDNLDLVHLCSLARCWAGLENSGVCHVETDLAKSILTRVESFRTSDGGYHVRPNQECGSAYGAFLASAAYADFGCVVPAPEALVASISALNTPDGGWCNERAVAPAAGSTNATAAAVSVLRQFEVKVPPSPGHWILARAHPAGGFTAGPGVPIPDLLSTATSLHTLAILKIGFEQQKQHCLEFIDSLWTKEGGFYGHWADSHRDCEYTFYALVALGYLQS